jgi:hypothetical protein
MFGGGHFSHMTELVDVFRNLLLMPGIGVLPGWITSLKRSCSKDRSMSLTVADDIVGGTVAVISKRSVSSQMGPPFI